MKIRYLSSEDRKNLRILRHSSDCHEKIKILEAFFRRSFYTLQDLWEYRKYFFELTEEFKADRTCFNTYAKHVLEMMLENY